MSAGPVLVVRTIMLVASAATAAACSGEGGGPASIVSEPVWHLDVALSPAGADLAAAAPGYLKSLDGTLGLGLSVDDEYQVVRVAAGRDGLRHARLQQLHAGVPVEGGQLVVHADDSTFIGLNGFVTKHLDGFDTAPVIDESGALVAARSERAAGASVEFLTEEARLVILPGEAGGATLAWRVELSNDPQAELAVGRWIVHVDAGSGDIVSSYDALPTEQASGRGGNSKKARSWSAQLDVEYAGSGLFEMATDRLETYDLASGYTLPATPVRGPLDPIGDAAINDAHGYGELTLDMMRNWYGHNSIDDEGFLIISRVHYGVDYENAFWNGFMMTYGDGEDLFHPLSGALDVVSHEINHGFTEFHSDLVYAGMSGGLNESFSDIAGTLAEFALEGEGADFDIGEDIFKRDGALRYMCDPPRDRAFYQEQGLGNLGSIDHASDFTPSLDVHFSSGVPNKAFCLSVARFRATAASNSTSEAARRVGSAWYLANASYWTSGTTFTEGCQGVIGSAHALGFSSEEIEALRQSWADVGVECGDGFDCKVDGLCDVDAGETCFSCASDCGDCNQPCSAWKRRKCERGTGDCAGCDVPPGCGDGLCSDDETDENCGEDCGCAAASADCDGLAPMGCWCDPLCEQFGDCCADADAC